MKENSGKSVDFLEKHKTPKAICRKTGQQPAAKRYDNNVCPLFSD